MKKLILFLLFSLPAVAFAQMYGGGHFSRVASGDSATYVASTPVTTYHSAGYADIWWSESSELWWVWDGSTYINWDPSASGTGGSLNTFPPNTQTGNYTLQQSDTAFTVTMHSASAQTITVPTGLKAGSYIGIIADSTGTNTLDVSAFVAGNILNASGSLTLTQGELCAIFYKSTTKIVILKSGAGGGGAWGTITGTLADQTDLQAALDAKKPIFNTAAALTDGSTITITGTKHTLTTTQATITFSITNPSDFSDTRVTFNQTSAVWTFPAGALCVVDGLPSGDNTATIAATSGDKIHISIWNIDNTNYEVLIYNISQ